jgi:hypothetical protein
LRVYWELARKAPRLGDDVIVTDWLREHTCKTAVKILREENRALDREALEKEKESPPSPKESEIAPPGLALRVSQGILLNAACNKSIWRFVPRNPLPAWVRPVHFGAAAACALALIIVWKNPFHKRNPIVLSPQTQLQLTPVSFGQLASSEEGFSPPSADTPNTNAGNNQSPP